MIYAVFNAATGVLVSTTDRVNLLASETSLAVEGLGVVALDITPWDAGGVWDAETRAFLPRPPEPEPEE